MDCSENPIIDDDVQQNECSDASEFNVENLLNLPGNYFFLGGGEEFCYDFGFLNL